MLNKNKFPNLLFEFDLLCQVLIDQDGRFTASVAKITDSMSVSDTLSTSIGMWGARVQSDVQSLGSLLTPSYP